MNCYDSSIRPMRARKHQSTRLTFASSLTRRQWLTLWTASVAVMGTALRAQQLPPGMGVAATPPCDPSTKPTPARTPAGYRANAPMRSLVVEANDTSRRLVLSGAVIGLRCGYIAGAVIETWQADASGVVPSTGDRLRGRQQTNAEGGYRLETVVPGAPAGQAPRINLKVTVPGKAVLTTSVFLPDAMAGAANKSDKTFDPLLAMQLLSQDARKVTASFNVILDL